MFNNITYKNKCYFLLLLIPLFFSLAYYKSFRQLLEANKRLKQLNKELILVENAEDEFAGLKDNIERLDAIIGKEVTSPDIVQQEIFDIFSEIPFNTNIVELDEAHKYQDDYFNVYTNMLLLEGSFDDLLKTTYYYERKFVHSRLVSLSFYLKESRRDKNKLFEQLIFQNYDKK